MRLGRRAFVAATLTALSIAVAPMSYAADKPLRVLVFGDSLTAGYGLADLKDAFPAQLERALKAKGDVNVSIVPAGVSGDTTTDGLTRLDWSLSSKPDAVIVELGGNDGLRGIDPKLTETNMRAIVTRIQKAGIPVLIAGMMAPPNLGRAYGDRFNSIFPAVAKDTGALFYPFFLDGVAGNPELNQADHIHPLPKGVAIIVDRILPSVEKLIAQARATSRPK